MSGESDLGRLLGKQWLLTNRLGAYCTSTFAGCNTSRYHGLLVGSAAPPVQRIVAISSIMETVIVGGERFDLACNEFDGGSFSPKGYQHVKSVDCPGADVSTNCVETTFSAGGVKLKKSLVLDTDSNSIVVRYEKIDSPADEIHLRPFTPLRDFHYLCKSQNFPGLIVQDTGVAVGIGLAHINLPPLVISADNANFRHDITWWYNFFYRNDANRGQDCLEDLPSPGYFIWKPAESETCEIVATFGKAKLLTFVSLSQRRTQQTATILADATEKDETAKRLDVGSEDFIVARMREGEKLGASVLAGFPWFADWGRDTFISLPGLAISTGRFELARAVFATYAEHISEGMVPNRFDDYGNAPHYNSIDASLWFILAAERYMQADTSPAAEQFWNDVLRDACVEIVTHYRKAARFGIHEDTDGLLVGGDENTQLTWMDAKVDGRAVTPRHEKAVEINALWYFANMMLAKRGCDEKTYAAAAEKTGTSFLRKFWLADKKYLADCYYPYGPDESLRPNQVIAAALPYTPLDTKQIAAVVSICRKQLLTPMGLRTLSPEDPRYRGRYEGPQNVRDMGYHQGTVWAWLIGFFVEAYLKTPRSSKTQAKKFIAQLLKQLDSRCVGQINEIFDGDAPHEPRGCFAQAWSLAEVRRALKMTE